LGRGEEKCSSLELAVRWRADVAEELGSGWHWFMRVGWRCG
jgi:hypothetical protein